MLCSDISFKGRQGKNLSDMGPAYVESVQLERGCVSKPPNSLDVITDDLIGVAVIDGRLTNSVLVELPMVDDVVTPIPTITGSVLLPLPVQPLSGSCSGGTKIKLQRCRRCRWCCGRAIEGHRPAILWILFRWH